MSDARLILLFLLAAGAVVALVLAAWFLLGTLLAPRTSPREWEQFLLLHVVGTVPPADERDLCDRALNTDPLCDLLVEAGAVPVASDAASVLRGARERLIARGAAAEVPPPPGSWEKAIPPRNLLVLTPAGAREALEVWRAEKARTRT